MFKKINLQSLHSNIRLDKALRFFYGAKLPQAMIEKFLREKKILVNGKKSSAGLRISDMDQILIAKAVDNLFQSSRPQITNLCDKNAKKWIDDHTILNCKDAIFIAKPANIASQDGLKIYRSIASIAKQASIQSNGQNGNVEQLHIVHRLDMHVSGTMVLARGLTSAQNLTRAFRQRNVEKVYICICVGHEIKKNFFEINEYFKEKTIGNQQIMMPCHQDVYDASNAIGSVFITLTKQISEELWAYFVCVRPKTGIKHQIRAQMLNLQIPIVGDTKYFGIHFNDLKKILKQFGAEKFAAMDKDFAFGPKRIALHSLSLKVEHYPKVVAPPPEDFLNLTKIIFDDSLESILQKISDNN